jgi:hypothetical protein
VLNGENLRRMHDFTDKKMKGTLCVEIKMKSKRRIEALKIISTG